jgi:hypothetical protein
MSIQPDSCIQIITSDFIGKSQDEAKRKGKAKRQSEGKAKTKRRQSEGKAKNKTK